MSTPTDYGPDEFKELATSHDMFDRLAATLSQPDIDAKVTRAVILQLAGAPKRPTNLGQDIRGNIHLAIVSDASANLSRFLSAVTDLAPLETAQMNGTNTTRAGAIGSVSGGDLTRGPLLDTDIELAVLEQLDATDSKTHDSFQQVLDTGAYSFSTSTYRETVSSSGSVLIGTNPEYGNWDQYEPISDQLNLTPALAASVDVVVTNFANMASSVQTSEDTLPVHLAHQYIDYSRSIDPELTASTVDEIEDYIQKLKPTLEEEDVPYKPGMSRLKESLERLALAHARLQLSETTDRSDATRVVSIVKSSFNDIGIDPEVGQFDADVVETGKSKEDRERIRAFKDLIKTISEEYSHEPGAPVEVIRERASSVGIDSENVDCEIESLRRKGEMYEPQNDYIRTT